jgi:hypothetical protein
MDLFALIALLAAFCSGAAFVLAAAFPRRFAPVCAEAAEAQPVTPPVIGAPADWTR